MNFSKGALPANATTDRLVCYRVAADATTDRLVCYRVATNTPTDRMICCNLLEHGLFLLYG
jgi:hypothetical protein